MNLNDLLALLPKQLVHYYSANSNAFWVAALNDVLAEIDRDGITPLRTKRIVVWNPDYAEQLIPPGLNYLRSVSTPEIKDLDFRVMEKQFIIQDDRWVPGNNYFYFRSGPNGGPLVGQPGYVMLDMSDSGIDPNYNFTGYSFTLVRNDDLSIPVSGIIVESWADNGLNSQMRFRLDTMLTLEYEIGTDYMMYVCDTPLILEGTTRTPKQTATSTIPLDDQWTRLLTAGMRYMGEIQMDEASTSAKFWAGEYARMRQEWKDHGTRPRGKIGRVTPHVRPRFGV